jgi:hypothetical protein
VQTWIDTRVSSPRTNSFDRYVVAFLFPITGNVLLGLAEWMPYDGYTRGRWQNVTFMSGNPVSDGEVLYWIEHPVTPELPATEPRKKIQK